MLSLYSACNRRWAFKYLKGFMVPTDNYSPLHFGSVIHEVQEAFYRNPETPMKAARKRLDELCPPIDSSENMENFRDKVDKTLKVWYDTVGQEDIEKRNILAIEEEMPLTLPNGYKMTVRVDRVLQNKDDGEVFVDDTKTTGWSLDCALRQYMMLEQPRLYIQAIRQNKPEWLEAFSGWRTTGVYAKKAVRSPGGYSIKVRRSPPVMFTEDQLTDVLVSYAGIVDDIQSKLSYLKDDSTASLFPANFGNCNAYNRVCPYYDFCANIDRIEVPPANLEVDPWLASGKVLDSFKEGIDK
jgi:hypothetical protein